MATRRKFLQAGLATLALPAVAGAAPLPLLDRVVFDQRFPAAGVFAAASDDLPSHAISGDVTDLWFDRLYPRWRVRPAALAGLTDYSALFCLERLAWDHGMRVVYRAEHRRQANGTTEHLLSGPASMLRLDDDSHWAGQVARQVARWPGAGGLQTATLTTRSGSPEDPAYLVSWVIAPRA